VHVPFQYFFILKLERRPRMKEKLPKKKLRMEGGKKINGIK